MGHKFTNALINETSPYLLQHAHNPVNWFGWHPDVWQKAKQEDKMVLVSIGYSACHWCHVMEHECFEDEGVSQIMNEHFVCIKVDREERPDVDQVYMDACHLITGGGGWPLNAFALPDGRPLYAGTYFPRERWKQVLLYFVDYWTNHRDEAFERAADITNGIRTMDTVAVKAQAPFTAEDRYHIFEKFDKIFDYDKGGRRGAPKFPMPVNLQYLLRNYAYTKNGRALQAVTVTLDNMMNGGIYDQLGGGFARYSVDDRWEIPHFEKMLYDNAQLVSLYSDAYRVTKNERYKEVVMETLEFIEREMSDAAGGFYSALDADSEGVEGRFYVWGYNELSALLGADFNDFCKVYNVEREGNFEGYINLTRIAKAPVAADKLRRWKEILLAERSKRIRPGLDDKILTAWNALMLKGYTDAYESFAQPQHLQRALQCAEFIKANMLLPDFAILRNYKNGKANISGFLDDYSFTCEAFIALYELTFNECWLSLAKGIADYVVQHFYNVNSLLFFYTSINDAPLITRKSEISDNVIPASNSSMFKALYKLGLIFENDNYMQMVSKAALALKEHILGHPSFYANWATLTDWIIEEPKQVVIIGESAATMRIELGQHFLPHCVFAGSKEGSSLPLLKDKPVSAETIIYVCQYRTCLLPQTNIEGSLALLYE